MKGKKDRGAFHRQPTAEIFGDILGSNLRPVEKLFLTLEWFLREKKPMELLGEDLKEISENAQAFVDQRIPVDLCQAAIKEAQEMLRTRNEQETFSTLLGLSYYSYVNDEFVYSHNMRKELISKIVEIGISPSRIQSLNNKWEKIAGSSEELFNKIFQR